MTISRRWVRGVPLRPLAVPALGFIEIAGTRDISVICDPLNGHDHAREITCNTFYPIHRTNTMLEKVMSLVQKLTDKLGIAIVSGEFLPGAVLPNEASLSSSGGIGRGSVREAVRMLQAKGMIESRPKRGTTVLPPRNWQMYDSEVQTWMRASNTVHGVHQHREEGRIGDDGQRRGRAGSEPEDGDGQNGHWRSET